MFKPKLYFFKKLYFWNVSLEFKRHTDKVILPLQAAKGAVQKVATLGPKLEGFKKELMVPFKLINDNLQYAASKIEIGQMTSRKDMLRADVTAALAMVGPGTLVGTLLMPFGHTYDSAQEHLFEIFYWDSIDRQFF